MSYLFGILLLVGFALAKTQEGPKVYSNAVMACHRFGGICLTKGECPADAQAQSLPVAQLCDENQECCHSNSDSVATCADRGGDCVADGSCGTTVDPKGHCALPGQVCCNFV